MRNDIETSPILEMKGKGLAFDHGGRQIEVEEAAPGLFKSLQCRGQWFDSPPLHHPLSSKPGSMDARGGNAAVPGRLAGTLPATMAGRRANSRILGQIRRPSLSAGFERHNFSSDLCGAQSGRSGEAQDPALLRP